MTTFADAVAATADRVKVRTDTVGTGPVTLGATELLYQSMQLAFGGLGVCRSSYLMYSQTQWETGFCFYDFDSDPLTVARNVPMDGSSGTHTLVDFTAGDKYFVISPISSSGINTGVRNNMDAGVDEPPTANDDNTRGYGTGSLWRYGLQLWQCTSAASSAAVWKLLSSGSVVDADVKSTLVTTTDATPTLIGDAFPIYPDIGSNPIRHFTAYVYANEAATGDTAAWRVEVGLALDGSLIVVGTPEITQIFAAAGAAAWAVTVDYTASVMRLKGTGEVAKSIIWAVKLVHVFQIELG